MQIPRNFPLLITACLLALAVSLAFAHKKDKRSESSRSQMSEQQRALHALNRLTFGPRPGDIERVSAMGVDKWIELQLHPEKINDFALETRLSPLRTLRMDTHALIENFPPPAVVKAVADGKMAIPSNREERAIYEAQLERRREKEQGKFQKESSQSTTTPQDAATPGTASPGDAGQNAGAMTDAQKQTRRQERQLAVQRADALLQMTPEQRFRELLQMADDDRRILSSLPPQEREQLMGGFTPQQRETVLALVNPQMVVTSELQQGKLLRAIYSERQLEEVMTDFWFNHFNVFMGKGADRYLLTGYERDVIRAHALGKFKDLLVATAKSPAMLFYLDNWMSIGPDSDFAKFGPGRKRASGPRPRANMGVGWGPWGPRGRVGMRLPPTGTARPPRPEQSKRRSGLNENYARELMELHTLGVNGGYTQNDVTEVAKVFTGWTLREPRKGGNFEFDERRHQPGAKTVLGKHIKEHGEDEGMQVLAMLAHHPSTARFISSKLAQRFVADDPPPALIDSMAKKFLESDGDIREVLRTMFRSPEFWSPQSYRAKVKTPLEFVLSAVRASGAEVQNTVPLVQALNRMGMPLYGSQPPTGYSMKADVWVNSAALLNRMNFALALAAGRMPGISMDVQQLLAGPQSSITTQSAAGGSAVLAELENVLLAGDVSRQTHDAINKQMQEAPAAPAGFNIGNRSDASSTIAGLILGSPEFQRR